MTTSDFILRSCECDFRISADAACAPLVTTGFAALMAPQPSATTALPAYRLSGSGDRFCITHPDGKELSFPTADALVFHLDKEIIVGLQHRRPDLFFLHAAVVEMAGRIAVLAAPSGTGKSTFTVALLAQGARYVSDELAPIDLGSGCVYPFPHALCLKAPPPAPWKLPQGTVQTGRRLYVSADAEAQSRLEKPPVSAFFFLRRSGGESAGPSYHRLTTAAAVAHLMSSALNLLAHGGNGLDAAVSLSRRVPAFELDTSDLGSACEVVKTILHDL